MIARAILQRLFIHFPSVHRILSSTPSLPRSIIFQPTKIRPKPPIRPMPKTPIPPIRGIPRPILLQQRALAHKIPICIAFDLSRREPDSGGDEIRHDGDTSEDAVEEGGLRGEGLGDGPQDGFLDGGDVGHVFGVGLEGLELAGEMGDGAGTEG